jgi:catechol 2,3-dioxygenase-like lactoylglutathione lyase family enzyme
MSLLAFEVGIVSTSRALVDFLAEVFELDELTPIESSVGTIYRLLAGSATVKVLVPKERPKVGERVDPFHGATGLRYLTMRVDDLEPVVDRATARRARVRQARRELRPGVDLVVLEDPDGNVIEVIEDRPLAAAQTQAAG